MAKRSKLTDDLAALAEEERARLDDPPTAEQLLAYRDGELPEDESERLRERLAVDPEWASIYLDLLRSADPGSSDDASGGGQETAGVDDAWRWFSARLERGEAARLHPGAPSSEVPPRRRSWGPLLLAAMVVLGLGLGWLLVERGRETDPSGRYPPEYYLVDLSDETFRGGADIKVPEGFDGVELHVDLSDLDNLPPQVRVRLSNASGETVWDEDMTVEPGAQLTLRIGLGSLELERNYELTVHPTPFRRTISFVRVAVTSAADDDLEPDSCKRLDMDLDRTNETYEQGKIAAVQYGELLDTAVAKGCLLEEARAHNGLGFLTNRESRLLESLDHFRHAQTAVDAAEGFGKPVDDVLSVRGSLAHNRGMAYFRLGWLEDARDAADLLIALRKRENASAIKLARALLLSARVHHLLDDAAVAAAAVQEGLDLLGAEGPKVRASLWQLQAWLDLDAERFRMADAALHRALEALEGLEELEAEANIMADLAETENRQSKWRQSLRWVDEALQLSEAAGSPDLNLEAYARHLQSVALSHLGDLEGAILAADSGLAMLEAVRSTWGDLGLRFFARRHDFNRHRLDLAVQAGDPQVAWRVFETSRARGLLETLRMQPQGSDDATGASSDDEGELQSLRRLLIEAIRQLDGFDPDAGRDRRELLAAKVRARKRDIEVLLAEQLLKRTGRSQPQIIAPGEAREMLDADTLGLVFASGTEAIHLLVLGSGDVLDLVTLKADRKRIAGLGRNLVHSLDPEAAQEAKAGLESIARELGRHLLGPLEGRLDGFQRLAIVADEPLEGLPFDVLRDPRSQKRLIDSHEVSILPSFSVLGWLRNRADACALAESWLLTIGDPVFSSRDPRWPETAIDPRSKEEALALERLPQSAVEASNVASLYPPSKARLLIGPEATRDRLLTVAPKYRVIHFASHARTDTAIPERSKIVLSCIDEDDRPIETCDLYFPDIVNDLDLCGQIVVLSACETASGEAVAGEGILGLPRAFLRAGASTVVASRWRVPDSPTARLMPAFHQHLLEVGEPAFALRRAKLDMIAGGEPPSVWSAFSLIGDWRFEAPHSTFPKPSGPMEQDTR